VSILILTTLSAVVFFGGSGLAVAERKPQATPTPTPKPSGNNTAIETKLPNDACRALVKRDVNIYASVLAPKNVSDIFGKRISKRYLAVQITIRNENKDFQLLVGDISIDFEKVLNVNYHPSSNDLSLVRGVSEKGQVYEWKNLVFRILRATGSLAAGIPSFMEVGSAFAPGIAVFNGPATEGFRDVLPDQTVNELNRLNDRAYASNTLVPKQSAKVMVAFIDQAMVMDSVHRKKFWNDPLSIAPDLDFRKVVAVFHGCFIAEVGEEPLVLTAPVLDDIERAHFKDDHPSVKGYIVGRSLDGATIQVESGPPGVSVALDGLPEAEKLDFILTADAPLKVGEVVMLQVVKGKQIQHIPLTVRYQTGNPQLDKLDPPTGNQGESVDITLTGSNFIKGISRVTVTPTEGIVPKVNDVTSTVIKINLTIDSNAKNTVRKITVDNGSGFNSEPQDFTVKKKSND
jgi:hypothetical protein